MSLVAYGSSDESENEEDVNEQPQIEIKTQKLLAQDVNKNIKLPLPIPKIEQAIDSNSNGVNNHNEQTLNFDAIPKPKLSKIDKNNFKEIDNVPVPNKINYGSIEKPPKKKKLPTKIPIPSLTDFKDLEEESEQNNLKKQPVQKKSGLIDILPPPKSSPISTKTNLLVPHILTKKPIEIGKSFATNTTIRQNIKKAENPIAQKKSTTPTFKSLSDYKSDSEDEDDKGLTSEIDFFSLSTPITVPDEVLSSMNSDELNAMAALSPSSESNEVEENLLKEENKTNKMLTSNVMNLPKEEILLKNKAEVGPKLPIPEQEYNVDSQGNVAFDEKAIEYLCGKRGVKRKNEFNNVDIIEISGEDIKPDEREWMIKALTDETIQKPISVGAGPSGQSKKKHQITYLAHQAKAMELELKNQWAQNKASRQQTRSKYGF